MKPRQADSTYFATLILFIFSACSVAPEPQPTPIATITPSSTPTITVTPSPIPPTATATPLGCLTQPGKIESGAVQTTNPIQEYLIYLPPCYQEISDKRYPVLYILHGQTYTSDQWVRLGVPQIVDEMFFSGNNAPFIVVFPDDRYWNLPAGVQFGERLIGSLIPYIDATYRTLPERQYRALGGLSRGGGWAVELGFENPQLFGAVGLHSPAIFKGDGYFVEKRVLQTPEELRPRLWLDVGDNDRELESIILFEDMLARNDYPHNFQLYTGDHSEAYWGEHVQEYIQWYASAWNTPSTTP